jgi:hypothetical protein
MTAHACITCISRARRIAGTLAIAAPGALYAVDFSTPQPKNLEPELLPATPADCPTGRELTQSEDEETIIINRPDRSTYPDRESVLTSGATPE